MTCIVTGIDLFISRSLSRVIKNNLDQKSLRSLEKSLFFHHGMSIKLSVEHFDVLHGCLKDNSDFDLENFEKNCLKKIIDVTLSDNHFVVKILDTDLSRIILNFYGDYESRCILQGIMGNSLTVPEILEKSDVLKSPAYRKIENLLLDGLIIESGKLFVNNKRVTKYTCIFDKIQIVIQGNDILIEGHVPSQIFNMSSIPKLI